MSRTTSFLSLFVPSDRWLQQMIKDVSEQRNISDYILQLVVHDMYERGGLDAADFRLCEVYWKNKPVVIKTNFNKSRLDKATFSLYMPKSKKHPEVAKKLRSLVDVNFVFKQTGFPSRSAYVWALFAKDVTDCFSQRMRDGTKKK